MDAKLNGFTVLPSSHCHQSSTDHIIASVKVFLGFQKIRFLFFACQNMLHKHKCSHFLEIVGTSQAKVWAFWLVTGMFINMQVSKMDFDRVPKSPPAWIRMTTLTVVDYRIWGFRAKVEGWRKCGTKCLKSKKIIDIWSKYEAETGK